MSPDVTILEVPKDGWPAAEAYFALATSRGWNCPVIAVLHEPDTAQLHDKLRLAIDDFVVAPVRASDLIPRILRRLHGHQTENVLVQSLKEKLGLQHLLGESPAFVSELKKIPAVARCDAGVLITGETGTGKEVFSRAIHYLSPRAAKPFVPINCGAIPSELLENELFGHAQGAFTGANATAFGIVHEANGGTLFLDEVDSLSLPAQVKLLRFLQEQEYRPLGSTKTVKADVRLIAASNCDFDQAVQCGRFRRDLYYRINVIPLTLPPLRQRPGDIPILARSFLNIRGMTPIRDFAPSALRKLMSYAWPGNVRELENLIQRTVVFCEDHMIGAEHIPLPKPHETADPGSFRVCKAKAVAEFEQNYISALLVANDGNISKAARAAKKDRRAFWELIRKHHIVTLPVHQPLKIRPA